MGALNQSLAFRALDRHVIDGRADAPAFVHGEQRYTYAELLHETSALAGGLRSLGIGPDRPVALDASDRRTWVFSILALVRLGARVDDDAVTRIVDRVVVSEGEEFDLETLRLAGRTDAAPAPAEDPGDYAPDLERRFGDVLTTLLRGGTIT